MGRRELSNGSIVGLTGSARRQMNRSVVIRASALNALAVASVLLSRPAPACSCYAKSGRAALPYVAAMFSGTATKVKFIDPDDHRTEPRIAVTFTVDRVWKGPVRETILVRTTYSRWTCKGFYFTQGKRYLVTGLSVTDLGNVAVPEVGGINPCGATMELEHAADVIRDLGPGVRPPGPKTSR